MALKKIVLFPCPWHFRKLVIKDIGEPPYFR